MKKIMLCYPPGDLSDRVKNRYKFNTADIFPRTMKACNDLGYMAATLMPEGHEIFLRDYKIEQKTALDFLDDILKFAPNVIVLKTGSIDIFEDLKLVRMIKSSNPEIVVILKSELFFNPSNDLLTGLPLGGVDYLIGSDAAFVLPKLIKTHFENPEMVYQIPFITICRNGLMQNTNFYAPHGNINELPFPARSIMKNEYYYRPDTRQVTATIYTSKGCSGKCLHCYEPILSDSTETVRPAQKVFEEMYECYSKYGIRSFFFPLDTFNHSEKWVEEFCDLIIASPMNNNVDWIANVNIAKFTEYMGIEMKSAGCSTVIMRFDCGSDDSLLRLNRGFTVDECYNSTEIARKIKLKIYGLFSVGYPWEDETHLKATKKMMLKICPDMAFLSMPVAYPNSKIEELFRNENILKDTIITERSIKIPPLGTKFLSHKFVRRYRRKMLIGFYLNPKYIFKQLVAMYNNPDSMKNYFNFVIELLKNKRQ
ncbi:MAG: B12-binding domain-containing radical SAM protein [Candidatus Gastranaerophilaceae bacterium]